VRLTLRFYADLNGFLPPERRGAPLTVDVPETATIKDVVEAQGVPHTEVDLLLAGDAPVDFAYRGRDGERIAVFPPFRRLDLDASALRPPYAGEARFVLDTHLGALATTLRLLGFDALYRNDAADPDLAAVAAAEGRILLTRDRGLLKRGNVTYGYHVWATAPECQAVAVLHRFRLFDAVVPFRRCLPCNGLLAPVPKAAVEDRLPPRTRRYYDDFVRCAACGRVYWRGAHFRRMAGLVERLLARRPLPGGARGSGGHAPGGSGCLRPL
jgi:uncharacterized protein with PIN domain